MNFVAPFWMSRVSASWILLVSLCCLAGANGRSAEMARSLTKDGITWTFDRPYPTGRFITGDQWVIGPVTVISVSPEPGPAPGSVSAATAQSRYGTPALVDDPRMRNGSMVIEHRGPPEGGMATGFDHQGYDSRAITYDPKLSIEFPYQLKASRSLVSTISQEAADGESKLRTPFAPGQAGLPLCPPTLPLALRAAAVLTCLEAEPPADAFRPAYAGTRKVIYRKAQLVPRGQLSKLKPVGPVPDWEKMERLFARPWLDHLSHWSIQYTAPGENQPNYGREFARICSLASLMVLLDVPAQQKEGLLVGFVQLGIDLAGMAALGRQWFSDGGHWQGRKWPILFASIVLNAPELATFPVIDPTYALYANSRLDLSGNSPIPTTLFQEDMDTYYAFAGGHPQPRWQIVYHSYPREPHEDFPSRVDDKERKLAEAYRFNNSVAAVGVALAVKTMQAQPLWAHDAFFDYVDRWMGSDEKFERPPWLARGLTRSVDAFSEAMWKAYRPAMPTTPRRSDRYKWEWSNQRERTGTMVRND